MFIYINYKMSLNANLVIGIEIYYLGNKQYKIFRALFYGRWRINT
jgi:hypothetical protein